MGKTFNPKKGKRRKKHGFLKRMGNSGGRRIIKRRRQKSRQRLAV
ncbi:MAG: 50S ribosomal protein L34 [Candidatus Azambacteria bacterium]|nr:50S ribosomal protein L34 [Candidatus Azambacteria bacterium]